VWYKGWLWATVVVFPRRPHVAILIREVPCIFERWSCCGDVWFIGWGIQIATMQTGFTLIEIKVRFFDLFNIWCCLFSATSLLIFAFVFFCFFCCCLFCYGVSFVFCGFAWTCVGSDLNDSYGRRFLSLYSWWSILCLVGIQK